MTIGGFLILLIVAAVLGALSEALAGWRAGYGWIGTMIVALIGAWIGSALFKIGPPIMGTYLISAILGAVVLIVLLKLVTGRRTA
ncbi:MAG TPA: GlsB/YeaQ/YmgE family stress response membrane protein [Armatimonadota bacterium]|nr:GlsB/YeaQ/YmgE family stress response membrane protein [Armatimonadota bacterium]